jgi:hypothetical protein
MFSRGRRSAPSQTPLLCNTTRCFSCWSRTTSRAPSPVSASRFSTTWTAASPSATKAATCLFGRSIRFERSIRRQWSKTSDLALSWPVWRNDRRNATSTDRAKGRGVADRANGTCSRPEPLLWKRHTRQAANETQDCCNSDFGLKSEGF